MSVTTTSTSDWSFTVFPKGPARTAEERWWSEHVELPLDIDHTCRGVEAWDQVLDDRRERKCPACQYIRGFKDGQKDDE